MDAQATRDSSIALLKVDIGNWESAVARRYNIRSIPHLKVYDAAGRLLAEGKDAYRYVK